MKGSGQEVSSALGLSLQYYTRHELNSIPQVRNAFEVPTNSSVDGFGIFTPDMPP